MASWSPSWKPRRPTWSRPSGRRIEFFAAAIIPASVAELQRRLTIGELPRWCASIEQVLSDEKTRGEIYCVRGTFHANREKLRQGVRFSLPHCPNAMQWTVTTGHDADFIDSIRQFVDDWKSGLEANW